MDTDMKLLGLDSSGLVASVAVMEEDNLLGEYTVNYKKTHSQTLLPMLDEVARMIELDFNTLDAIAVAGGPGSFTGLRIGSATAKGLGLALNVPIVNVPTVDALAYNLAGHQALVCPLMDARRNQTYTGLYRFRQNEMEVVREQCAVGIDEIADGINRLGEAVVVLGDGVPVFRAYLREHLLVPWSEAPAHLGKQRAGAVAALGMKYFSEGRYESAKAHRPEYLRLSQAEREAAEKRAAAGRQEADA
ncbi:MAG: tRNA (adenosine(37)-N6)-threonylcarbamoyltransferase complex dimerization subunit type 1 TsaB [Roseburia sp.]|jgi:tRNA threonylcarbamoyladenosine biosynthesis protein TsaB|nr:tRNA (adenosine(37)-N6)-threonylcarbamoyltransferase complex dimerization subunit type 1 TsaB [Roseburia sp.]